MEILFVNACVRADESNTLRLCRVALDELCACYPDAALREVDLSAIRPLPLYGEDVKNRSALHAAQQFDDSIYGCAHDFARADLILIGAPYWDLSFPSALKVYLERVCAAGVTFATDPEGKPYSLCRGKRLLYITTAGALIERRNLGYDYVNALGETFFAFPAISCFALEGFDLGGDVAALLEEGKNRLLAEIRSWQ